jgi:transposase
VNVIFTQQVSYERKQKETRVNHPGRNALPEKLRQEEIVLNPEGIELTGEVLVSEDATEVLAYTPPEYYVKRTIRPLYLLPFEQRMVQAAAPEHSFSRSSEDVSVGALIAVEKKVDHIPQCSASGSHPVQPDGYLQGICH